MRDPKAPLSFEFRSPGLQRLSTLPSWFVFFSFRESADFQPQIDLGQ